MVKKICKWLGINQCEVATPVYDRMITQLQEIYDGIQEVRQDLQFDKELLLRELHKKDVVIKAMIEKLPDMLWFKDMDGKYVYANKAIRDGLLFDDKPEGKTDLELSLAAKERFGETEHTFGDICGDSDVDVKMNEYDGMRYVESGKIRGKITHLEVNKSIIKIDGKPIGVVGSGRDITEYREELLSRGDKDVFQKNEFMNKDV